MPAQRQDATARAANIAEQQLQNCGRADDLRSLRLLCPTEGVANRTSLLRTGSPAKGFSDFKESFFGNATIAFNHFRRVARKVFFQELVDTSRMRQSVVRPAVGEIDGGSATLFAVAAVRRDIIGHIFVPLHTPFIKPSAGVVFFVLRIPARKYASEIFGVLEILRNDGGSVGVVDNILTKVFAVFENVVNESSEEEDVRSGTQRSPDIGHCGSAAEPRVNVNHLRSSLPGFHDPLETYGMIFSHVRSHDQNGVGIDEVTWCSCRSPSTEGCAQTGHRGAMSYTGLVADAHHAQACGE